MFAPTRDEARHFLAGSWAKFKAAQPLTGLETMAAGIVALHPEYQPLLDDAERSVARDFRPEDGTLNPFLHLSLHLAVAEQLSIDQPPGLRAQFERLKHERGDEHAALHALVECLGETLWHAQRAGSGPDAEIYLACLARQR